MAGGLNKRAPITVHRQTRDRSAAARRPTCSERWTSSAAARGGDQGSDVDLTFERLAVTEDQIVDLSLWTRQTKSTTHGKRLVREPVEVDAIPSSVLRTIVGDAIERWIDDEALRLTRIAEESERALLLQMSGAS